MQSLAIAGAAVALPGFAAATTGNKSTPFRLHYAPHEGLFADSAGPDIIAQIHRAADLGFRGWEDNEMRNRDAATQASIGAALKERGMQMGVFVAAWPDWNAPTLSSGDAAQRESFLAQIRESVEVAKRIGATWMTVVAGFVDLRLSRDYQMVNLVESLRQGAAILEPHGLVMVLEPLNNRDHPGQLVTDAGQALLVCQSVNSPSCKMLYDIYHQQTSEGNLIQNIDRCWHEIAYVQIGDNPGRNEPTTGEINYRNVFKHLHGKGYTGVLGMEHGRSKPGLAGEEALVAAYRYCDDFEA